MAQTTGGLSMVIADLLWSANGSAWTDISGYASAVEDVSQERNLGEAYTFDGDTAIITHGKRTPIDLDFNLVYTEDAGSPWEALRPYWEAGSAVYWQWIPKGSTATNFKFTTGAVHFRSFPYPAGEAESGDPVMVTIGVRAPAITKGVVS